jgi:hypothetical protein
MDVPDSMGGFVRLLRQLHPSGTAAAREEKDAVTSVAYPYRRRHGIQVTSSKRDIKPIFLSNVPAIHKMFEKIKISRIKLYIIKE